jgi:P-type Ca2+ transporter type 2C
MNSFYSITSTAFASTVRMFGAVGIGVSVLAVALYGALRGHWLDALLGGIALGMSMLPEEFPVMLAVFMAMGAWRISRARVLTRRAAAIETLGSATVLCTDKTGTLTENRMTIAELRRADGRSLRLGRATEATFPDAFRDVVHVGVLASAREPFDQMEKACHELRRKRPTESERPGDALELAHVYGLRPDLLAVTQVWKPAAGGSKLAVASKGVPEAIAELCHFEGAQLRALKTSTQEMAADGLRVSGSRESGPFRRLASVATRIRIRIRRACGPCRSAAGERARGGGRVSIRRHPGRDDHGRLSGDCGRHRAPGGAGRYPHHDRPGARKHGRRGAEAGNRRGQRVRPHHARPEAADRQGAQG